MQLELFTLFAKHITNNIVSSLQQRLFDGNK